MLKYYGVLVSIFFIAAIGVYAHRMQQSWLQNRATEQSDVPQNPVPENPTF